jgi:hypothetical protein
MSSVAGLMPIRPELKSGGLRVARFMREQFNLINRSTFFRHFTQQT